MTTDLLSELDERVSRARQLLLPRCGVDFALSPGPDLLSYDHYVISISGGKDSQASLDSWPTSSTKHESSTAS
ncbi:hypothetical protein ACQP2U_24635 [Nocardia sp. CA-084685]|uniref:hypothetical protein n=1 Tax=Nocardia sp. CA-084685 TaxID=3239970 RepID=UPI003D96B8CD